MYCSLMQDVFNKLTDKDLACAQCNVSDHTLPLWKVMCTLADPQPAVPFDDVDPILSMFNASMNEFGNETMDADGVSSTAASTVCQLKCSYGGQFCSFYPQCKKTQRATQRRISAMCSSTTI